VHAPTAWQVTVAGVANKMLELIELSRPSVERVSALAGVYKISG
jgi:hypothetical protein